MSRSTDADSSAEEERGCGGGEDAESPAIAAPKKRTSKRKNTPAAESPTNGGDLSLGASRKADADDVKKPKKTTGPFATGVDYSILFGTLEELPHHHFVSLAKGLGQHNTMNSLVSLYLKRHKKNLTEDHRSDQTIRQWILHEISLRFRKGTRTIPMVIREDAALVETCNRLMEKFINAKENGDEESEPHKRVEKSEEVKRRKEKCPAALEPENEKSAWKDADAAPKDFGGTPPLPTNRPDPSTTSRKEKISIAGKASSLPCCRQEANLPPAQPADASFNVYAVEGGGDSSGEEENHDETVDDVGDDNSLSPGTTSPAVDLYAKTGLTRSRPSQNEVHLQTLQETALIGSKSSPSEAPQPPKPTRSVGKRTEPPRNLVEPTKQPDLTAHSPLDMHGDARGGWRTGYESSQFAKNSSATGGRSQQASSCHYAPCRLEASCPRHEEEQPEETSRDGRDERKKLAPPSQKKEKQCMQMKNSSTIPAEAHRHETKCHHESSMKLVQNESARIHSLMEENELLRQMLSGFLSNKDGPVNDNAPGELETQPASRMVFNAPFHWSPPLPLMLINSSPRQILWMIRASEKVEVKPDHGLLLPGKHTRIDVALTWPEVGRDEDERLTVEWSNIEANDIRQQNDEGLIRRKTVMIEFNH